ncbi:MAG: hypothetical protein JRI46_09020 [Deltaproteobacteria bacterium]|nr:hypothetical protein [Deltaproteobacteria bacterium]
MRSYIQFKSIFEKYKSNTLRFEDLDEFVTDKDPTLALFNLKESCHILYRDQEEKNCRDEETLLDLAVGSIFHEAMKIRECLYQLEIYKPRYMQIRNRLGTSEHESNLLRVFEKIGLRAEKRLAESMTEAKRLFQDTLKQLAVLLTGYRDNPVLMRFLLRNKDLLQKAFGKRKGVKLITEIFPGGLGEAYEVEGKGYLESEHYDLAAEFFYQALKHRPHDEGLKGLYLYARGMDGYYRDRYHESLKSFHKLFPLANRLKNGKGYLEKVEEVCRKIGRECLEDKKRKMAHLALQLAEKLRRSSMQG